MCALTVRYQTLQFNNRRYRVGATGFAPVGQTGSDGHNFLYTDAALWEDDVFKSLDQYVRQ